MPEANFPKSLHYVLENEGGNDDDPDDHGGRTSRAWRGFVTSTDAGDAERLRGTAQRAPGPPNSRMIF